MAQQAGDGYTAPSPGGAALAGPTGSPLPGSSRPVQAQRRRTRTAASLLCRAAAAPCPPCDACCLSLIYLPLLLKLYRQVGIGKRILKGCSTLPTFAPTIPAERHRNYSSSRSAGVQVGRVRKVCSSPSDHALRMRLK
ncbi:hypothetical protein B8P98_10885 [Klebsiella quasivariicola]|nr:hypothetical protein B8P98_10885 [Klebsiella quasivariicola]